MRKRRLIAAAPKDRCLLYEIGSVHSPFNGASDYDCANTRTFATYADDFVENYPAYIFQMVVDRRDACGNFVVGDWQSGYPRILSTPFSVQASGPIAMR